MLASRLTEAVAAVCPIEGVSIGRVEDRSTWRIAFRPEATAAQRAAAQEILAAFQDVPVASQVKVEARRRILARYPDWKQSNMTARGVELLRVRLDRVWTAEEQAEADALQAAWDWIKTVRETSDQIEAMDPIPSDYESDGRWPA